MSYSKTVDKLSTKTLLTVFLFFLAVVLFLGSAPEGLCPGGLCIKGLKKTSAAWFNDAWMYRKAVK